MKDDHRKSVGEWLSHNFEWKIPVYQRHYAWDAHEIEGTIHLFWDTVKEQVKQRLAGEKLPPHYLGAVLVDEKRPSESVPKDIKYFDVVDGQQRLTTITLALFALIKAADENDIGDKIKSATNKFLLSDIEATKPKIQPINFDSFQFKNVVFQSYGSSPTMFKLQLGDDAAKKSKIIKTYTFFAEKFDDLIEKYEMENAEQTILAILETLTNGFDIILIQLRDTDKAQIVFESINNTARPLTTFDLIRNNVFERAARKQDGKDIALFNSSLWQSLEKVFWEGKADKKPSGGQTHIEAYIARMLVAKMKKPRSFRFNRNDIIKTYKKFSQSDDFSSIEEEIESMTEYTEIYKFLMSEKSNHKLGNDFNLGLFRYSISNDKDLYPVIFILLTSDNSRAEKQKMLGLLESFVVRRTVCGLSSGNLNILAEEFCRDMDNKTNLAQFYEILMHSKATTSKFPTDEDVDYGCETQNFYKMKLKNYILREIEMAIPPCNEMEVSETLHLDHIMPRSWEKTDWRIDLGISDKDDGQQAYLMNTLNNTIGNLTLLTADDNLSKSNNCFKQARRIFDGSRLKMNQQIAKNEQWSDSEIRARMQQMAKAICARWQDKI